MIKNILKDVQSPFSDDFIKLLVDQYIKSGSDDNLFYEEINKLNQSQSLGENEYLHELIDQIKKYGTSVADSWLEEESNMIYDIRESWVVLKSERDPMKEKVGGEKPLVYRIYLNLNGKEKVDFITGYLERCKQDNMPYEFKFSMDDSRNDQIIILSRIEELEKNISFVEGLTSECNLGEPAALLGKYKGNIGIGEEYYNRLYSPTKVKLALVRSSVKKYLLDHKDEFYEELAEKEKEQIDSFCMYFDCACKDIEKRGDGKRKYQKKSSLICAKEHIENSDEAYCCGNGLKGLREVIERIYRNNGESFLEEVCENFRKIGNEVWGFAKDFVFSVDTEENFMKENKDNLDKQDEGR